MKKLLSLLFSAMLLASAASYAADNPSGKKNVKEANKNSAQKSKAKGYGIGDTPNAIPQNDGLGGTKTKATPEKSKAADKAKK